MLHLLIAKGYKTHCGHENQYPLFQQVLKHPSVSSNINVQDLYGFTPLHYACTRKDSGYIVPLVQMGADPYIKDNKGNNCFEVIKLDEQARTNIIGLALDNVAGDLVTDGYLQVSHENYIGNHYPLPYAFSPNAASAGCVTGGYKRTHLNEFATGFDKQPVGCTDENLIIMLVTICSRV